MPDGAGAPSTRTEAVAVFDAAEQMQAAIDELLNSSFDQAEISLLASGRAVEQKLGHLYERVHQLEDAEDAPRKEYVSTAARGHSPGRRIGSEARRGGAGGVGSGRAP